MKQYIRDILFGLSDYKYSFKLLRTYRLWGYCLVPMFISLGLGLGALILIGLCSYFIGGWIFSFYPDNWYGAHAVETWLGPILVFISLSISFLFLYKYLVMAIVAPFMSMVSETIEKELTGKTYTQRVTRREYWAQVGRGLKIAIRLFTREMGFTILLLFIGLIPFVGALATPALILIQSYYAGFGNFDYVMERRLSLPESIQFVRSHRGIAMGNGLPFVLLLFVPILGLMIAPPLCTVAATVSALRLLEGEDKLNFPK